MLILTRRVGEILVIGDNVEINILGVKGTQVRFGITAPPEVSVHREEIYQKIKNQKLLDKENNISREDDFYESRGNK